ncbi:MAG TPA: hypothetical protein VFT59_01160 [Candidatus Saccharimonadales bacterium]|nr:hypothetical protein [Candidatus Saccharimonadales bacterium]
MGAPHNLPRELQEVEDKLQEALRRGGLEACRKLVNDLAVEAEFGSVIGSEAELVLLETEEDKEIFPEIRDAARDPINSLGETKQAGLIASARYSYAVLQLSDIEDANH